MGTLMYVLIVLVLIGMVIGAIALIISGSAVGILLAFFMLWFVLLVVVR